MPQEVLSQLCATGDEAGMQHSAGLETPGTERDTTSASRTAREDTELTALGSLHVRAAVTEEGDKDEPHQAQGEAVSSRT